MSKKNTSPNLASLKNYSHFITQFHYLIFILIMLGGVAYTVYRINVILNLPTDQAYKLEKSKVLLNDDFDQETISKLKKLNYSNNPQPIILPQGRNNPFAE